MAQLPPKVPNWPSLNHEMTPPPQPSWMEEFLDFSSARRNYHRRSVSDPIAFVEEMPCAFDDNQLSSMFSDDAPLTLPSCSSTASDQNSDTYEEKVMLPLQLRHHPPKDEPGEVDSECPPETPPPKRQDSDDTEPPASVVDPKRVKRILANRQSAQRSRVRKLQYISELERSVTSLQTEVSTLSPRVAFLDHQRLILNIDNTALKQRIAALAQDKIFKDAHQEALRKEIERLRKVYEEQSITSVACNKPPPSPPQVS